MRGSFHDYFETGTGGTYWVFFSDNESGYENFKIIESGDRLTIFHPKSEDIFWEGEIILVGLESLRSFKNKQLKNYFSMYVKTHLSGVRQFNLAGRWVHSLPLNFDLGMWYKIFLCSHDSFEWRGILKKRVEGKNG